MKAILMTIAAIAAVGMSAAAAHPLRSAHRTAPGPACRNEPVRAVRGLFASRAQGRNGAPLPVLHLWSGYSTDLDYIATQETVQKVWIDDPSRVAVSFDGCLASTNRNGANECGPVKVLHLKRIRTEPVLGLLQAPRQTLLTVVTDGPHGRERYKFLLALVEGTPCYYALAIYPDSQGAQATPLADGRWQGVDRGLGRAAAQKLVSPALKERVERFLGQVRSGDDPSNAAAANGLSEALIEKLSELGVNDADALEYPHWGVPPLTPPDDASSTKP
jgi:hypothetical protein